MPMTRQERDSLGTVDVPSEALYGAQTTRALQNFQISHRSAHSSLIRAYLRLKSASAFANRKADVITQEVADLITQAVDDVIKKDEEIWSYTFPVDPYQAGAGTSQNMNFNEVLANVANRIAGNPLGSYKPVHPNDHVNCSQSTNDTYPTAMRLAILESSKDLYTEIEKLSDSFERKAKAWKNIAKSGRTHLQDAVPIRLGQELHAYALTCKKCATWLESGRDSLRNIGIGGSATGTGLNVPATFAKDVTAKLEELTGETLHSAEDKIEAMQSQGAILHFSSMMRLLAVELTRICNDLRLMASGPSTGLSEILLPAVQPGSSIMPGKVNPSILEMVNQTLFSVIGYDQTIALCVQAGQLELNVMMPMMAYSALEAIEVSTNALRVLREHCIDGMEANEPRLRKYFESTSQIATALTPKLGYDAVSKLVQEAIRDDKSVLDLVRERKLIAEDELKKLIDIDALTGTT